MPAWNQAGNALARGDMALDHIRLGPYQRGPCQTVRAGNGRIGRSAGVGQRRVLELLGGVTLHEKVTVIQGFEVNFDDVGTRVVDPHNSGLYW